MTLDLEAGRAMVRQCVSQCRATETDWFYSTDVVALDTGDYVSDSCMRDCVNVAEKFFKSVIEAGTTCADAVIDSGKHVLEISDKDNSNAIFALILTIGIATIGIYYLCRRNWVCLSAKT